MSCSLLRSSTELNEILFHNKFNNIIYTLYLLTVLRQKCTKIVRKFFVRIAPSENDKSEHFRS